MTNAQSQKVNIGDYAPDFELPGVDGEVHHLGTYLKRKSMAVVVFMCNHCPYVKAYWERLKAIQTDYADQGVQLIGVNANDVSRFPEDSFDKMKEIAAATALNYPYLRDESQDVARAFGAERTPEIYVVDAQGIVRYNGCIDDNYGDPSQVTRNDLRDALDQILATGTVTTPVTQAIGCSIKWSD